jgi:isopenicillin-N epimerase
MGMVRWEFYANGLCSGMPARNPHAEHWLLDPAVTFLNHGSFGACPTPVLDAQKRWRARLEREPVVFMTQDLEGLLDEALRQVGEFVGAQAADIAFVTNATTGVNTVLASLDLQEGDEVLVTDHGYGPCKTAAEYWGGRKGARVVVAKVPFPLSGPDDVVAAVMGAVSTKTRLAIVDHITSPTALVFPIERLVRELQGRGVDTLVDGAHGPGMCAVGIDALGAAYYVGNFHKWCCAPKGAALLHVRRDRQEKVHPLVISGGPMKPGGRNRTDRSRFRLEFDWLGSQDVTAFLSVPAALQFLSGLLPGGWPALAAHNREMAVRGRRVVAEALRVELPCPDEMIGSTAALPLPDAKAVPPPGPSPFAEPLHAALVEKHKIQVMLSWWPAAPRRLVRLSAQAYNTPDQYERLAEALRTELAAESTSL